MTVAISHKQSDFAALVKAVSGCRHCDRMSCSQRVLNEAIGPLNAKVMFVGEAPGRLGADASGIPFHGDVAGANFEQLLEGAGLSRYDCVVTNAVLCNPKDDKGNNATPKPAEVRNCSEHLKRQIEIIDPGVVVSLGGTALKALSFVDDHHLALEKDVRSVNPWFGRYLIPLYHPGQRAMIHRSFANQRSDYRAVAEQLRKLERRTPPKQNISGRSSEMAAAFVRRILSLNGPTEYFAIHKLMFLADVRSASEGGGRLWPGYVVRQKDGPYYTDLNIHRLKRAIPELRIKSRGNSLVLIFDAQQSDLFADGSSLEKGNRILDAVVRKYGHCTNAELKKNAYLTRPMRNLLKIEADTGVGKYNCPIMIE